MESAVMETAMQRAREWCSGLREVVAERDEPGPGWEGARFEGRLTFSWRCEDVGMRVVWVEEGRRQPW